MVGEFDSKRSAGSYLALFLPSTQTWAIEKPTIQSLTLSSSMGWRGHWVLGPSGPTKAILKILGVTGFQLQLSLRLSERRHAHLKFFVLQCHATQTVKFPVISLTTVAHMAAILGNNTVQTSNESIAFTCDLSMQLESMNMSLHDMLGSCCRLVTHHYCGFSLPGAWHKS